MKLTALFEDNAALKKLALQLDTAFDEWFNSYMHQVEFDVDVQPNKITMTRATKSFGGFQLVITSDLVSLFKQTYEKPGFKHYATELVKGDKLEPEALERLVMQCNTINNGHSF